MTRSSPFKCPNCKALYEVVRVEGDSPAGCEITCRKCGGPLQGRDDKFVLKYFLMRRPSRFGRDEYSVV